MPYLKIKTGVRPRSLIIAAAAINAGIDLGFRTDVLVTSGDEPTTTHMLGSRHYTGNALDLRTKHLSDAALTDWLGCLRRRLGPDYQLIVEKRHRPNEHLHVEWQPGWQTGGGTQPEKKPQPVRNGPHRRTSRSR